MRKRFSVLMALAVIGLVLAMPTAAAGGGCHVSITTGMSTGTKTAIPVSKCAFRPTVNYIEPGDRLTWTNKDPVPHTVTGAHLSWGPERILDNGESVRYVFKSEGVYPYYCVLHPGMVGAVVVGDATAPAALTNGAADVEEIRLTGQSAAETSTQPSTSTTNLGLIATLAAAIVLISGVFVTRGALVKKRAAITPTTLS